VIRLKSCDFTASWEGCVLHVYKDQGGLATVGYGHLIKEGETFDTITQEQAIELLEADIETAEHAVARLVDVQTNDDQYTALVDLVYNVGEGTFGKSHTRILINSGAPLEDIRQRWETAFITANGIPSNGLIARRKAEAELYCGTG
jgi:lysozyme